MVQMQQAPFVWSGVPPGGLRHKHKLDEVDDLDQNAKLSDAASTATPQSSGVAFSQDSLEAANAFVAAAKRRKGNTGKVTLPPDLEPQFENLSLRNIASAHLPANQPSYAASPVLDELPPKPGSSSSSGRFNLSSPEGLRGRREVPPLVNKSPGASAAHRKRSSSRNRARKGSSISDADMKPAPRYDPARPHVVFVDTLSDSDEDDDAQNNDTEADSDALSALTTPGNSPSSSEAEDNAMNSPLRGSARPIQMNKRLRDHLRKQAMLQRLGHKPVTEGLLANAAPTTGGAGVHERGLVLYRPLSWGIVEEPKDDEGNTVLQNDANIAADDVMIQELPISGETLHHASLPVGNGWEVDGMDLDQDMEVDP